MNIITRSGTLLKDGASTFRFAGANMYWGALAEKPTVRYPAFSEIDDGLLTAKEMGATVIRVISAGNSVGNSLSIWPTLGSTNLAAFNTIDYLIYRCGQLGLRLLYSMIDNSHFYAGGKHVFTDWRGLGDETLFYTNATVIADYQAYVAVIMGRVNQFNSVAYINDPAILCWQIGSELSNPYPTLAWTTAMAAYMKGLDPNHLIMDGETNSDGMNTGASQLALANIDIYDGTHQYPTINSILTSDAAAVAAAGKAFVVCEFDWTLNGATLSTAGVDNTTAQAGTYSAKIIVPAPAPAAQAYFVQLQQANLSLVASTQYDVSFWAKSASGTQFITVAVQLNVNPYTVVYTNVFYLTTAWTQYTFTFTQPSTTTSFIGFNYAEFADTYWLDTVSMVPHAGGSNLIQNPGFEAGTLANWTLYTKASDDLPAFLSSVEGNASISGTLYWNLQNHASANGFVLQGVGTSESEYSMYYPGLSSDLRARSQQLRTHAYKMQGVTPAPASGVITTAPLITKAVMSGGACQLAWRGVPGAYQYVLQTAPAYNGPWTTFAAGSTDWTPPLTDAGLMPYETWYRIAAQNYDGSSTGPYSIPVVVSPGSSYGYGRA